MSLAHHISSWRRKLDPYWDIILFALTLLASNLLWKAMIQGDEGQDFVTWFGCDISAPFNLLSDHIAVAVYWMVDLVRDTVHLFPPRTIRFDSGAGLSIAWSCTAIKQSFIWLCLLLTTPGAWKQKLWFIPLGWVGIYAFNILRIAAIALFVEFHPNWFVVLHDYIFKYIFYGLMFLLWVWFVQRIRPAVSTESANSESTAPADAL